TIAAPERARDVDAAQHRVADAGGGVGRLGGGPVPGGAGRDGDHVSRLHQLPAALRPDPAARPGRQARAGSGSPFVDPGNVPRRPDSAESAAALEPPLASAAAVSAAGGFGPGATLSVQLRTDDAAAAGAGSFQADRPSAPGPLRGTPVDRHHAVVSSTLP